MLNYTTLFSDLEELFAGAGRDPASFRRLAREVARTSADLQTYYAAVSRDYVERLMQRLAGDEQPNLSAEESGLLRAFLGLPPADTERDQKLLDDLGRLQGLMSGLSRLKGAPLSMRNLEILSRQLEHMATLLPGITLALDARESASRFEEAVGDGQPVLDPDWLVRELQRALGEEAPPSLVEDDEDEEDTGQLLAGPLRNQQ